MYPGLIQPVALLAIGGQLRFSFINRGENFYTGDQLVLGRVTNFDPTQANFYRLQNRDSQRSSDSGHLNFYARNIARP